MNTAVFCQGCLTTKQLVLFNSNADNYQSMFQICFNIKVGFNTANLEWICKECVEQLNKAVDFKQRVEKTQLYLQEHFLEKYKKNDEGLEIKEEDIKSDQESFDDNVEVDLEPLLNNLEPKLETDEKKSNISLKRKKKIKSTGKTSQKKSKRRAERRWSQEVDFIPQPKAKCKKCQKIFEDDCSLLVHKLNEHGNTKANPPEYALVLSCSECNVAFHQLEMRNEHMIQAHASNMQKVTWETRNYARCTICGHFFPDFSTRTYHLAEHYVKVTPPEMLIKCSECDGTYKTYQGKAVHMYNEHKKWITLPQGGVYLHCKFCDIVFEKAFSYRRHMKDFHSVESGLVCTANRCKICGVFLTNLPDWRNHVDEHGVIVKRKPKPVSAKPMQYSYKCRICVEKFPLKSLRNQHMESVHDFKDKFPCEVCGQELSSTTALNKHLRTHTKEIVAICDYCGYGVKDKFDLPAHFTKHYEVKPFKCETCFKEFKRPGNLRQHKKIHFAKQFTCSLCGMQFTHKYNMKSHMSRNHNQSFLAPII